MSTVRCYLDAVAAQDWDNAASCLADDVCRVGPFGDVYEGRDSYLAFLRDVMPKLSGYRMDVHRYIEADRSVVVELTETVATDERIIETPESLIFDLDGEGRIARITIYVQRIGTDSVSLPRHDTTS
jgi:limonene-1,2-epoxide hydrolase